MSVLNGTGTNLRRRINPTKIPKFDGRDKTGHGMKRLTGLQEVGVLLDILDLSTQLSSVQWSSSSS